MKRLSILLAAASLLVAIAGCQKEPAGNENAESAKAYAEFSISYANLGTKASMDDADGNDGFDAGTEGEYAVKNATLYFVSTTDHKVAKILEIPGAKFTQHVEGPSGNVTYTSQIDDLDVGTYNVYATVNCTLTGVAVGTAEADLQLCAPTSAIPGTDLSNGIPMTSRNTEAANRANADEAGLYAVVNITAANTKDNPCKFELTMERAWAKIAFVKPVTNLPVATAADYDITNNVYKVYDKKTGANHIASITLKQYKVLNQTTKWNSFRQTCSLTDAYVVGDKGFGLFGSDYLFDPEIANKTKAAVGTYLMSDQAAYQDLPATAGVLAYTYENALYKDAQVVGYVTTVQFTGQIKPSVVYEKKDNNSVQEYTYTSGDLYFYNDVFYKDLDAVNAGAKLGVNDTNFRDFGVKLYEGGVCYYNYYIRHWNNDTLPPAADALGVMEYAIVRNNSYEITVTKVASTGDDQAVESVPTAETPVEQVDTYFQVKLTIRPWVVRAQDAVLG